jgi:uncharacterized membrane protein
LAYGPPIEVMVKFYQIPDLCRKVQSVQISDSARSMWFLIVIIHKSLTLGNRNIDDRESERVVYRNSIWNFQNFG